MIIQHNMQAINAANCLGITNNRQSKKTEKLSSGYRVNRAADDAAGLAISEKMRWMIRGLAQGTRNTIDGVSFVQIGDGAMGEIHDMIHRMEELGVKASNETLEDDDRSMIDEEVQQLKQQINMIHRTTVFNEIQIFDNTSSLYVNGVPNDMSLFDASYDDATGAFSYGGFLFNGERVKWSKVDADMVDTATGQFTGGDYTYTQNRTTYSIHTEAGEVVPGSITRTLSVSANTSGITIDGNLIPLNNLYDENGNPASGSNFHTGSWSCEYKGAEITFDIQDDIESLAEMISDINTITDKGEYIHYVWENNYVADALAPATYLEKMNNVRISQPIADALIANPDLGFVVHADEDGIYLSDKNDTRIPGSEKSWDDMHITSWDSGYDISYANQYRYNYDDTVGELVSFTFRLENETSLDSVIDGLDGMVIDCSTIHTNYLTKVDNTDNHIKLSASSRIDVSFEDEYALARDFDTRQMTLANQPIQYDSANQKASLVLSNSGNDVISLEGSTADAENTLNEKMDPYIAKYADALLQSTILGEPIVPQTLTDVVGSANITGSGYFSENVTLTGSMQTTGSANKGSTGSSGSAGSTYPTASINFENLHTATDVKKLIGTGFDSTCKTCDEHYSVVFTDSLGASANTTADGYRYKVTQNGVNKKFEIDINSLTDHGVSNGEDLTAAFVKIATGVFDKHYTQYAADGSTLYIYDNRAQSTPAPAADFWTSPYESDSVVNVGVSLSDTSGDGDYVRLNYNYDLLNLADRVVEIRATDVSDGAYVLNADITPGQPGYSVYDSSNHAMDGLTRYNLETVYKDTDGNDAADRAAAVSSHSTVLLNTMLTDTSLQLNARDYSTVSAKASVLPNKEVAPVFESNVYRVGKDDMIYIVHSGMEGDTTGIPRFAMNTAAMGLSSANTKTVQSSRRLLDQVKRANQYVSEKRAIYGAVQNRLEHTINNNQNKEENMTAAESRIRDTDMAKEISAYTNNQILLQAGQAMLAQANQTKQGVLNLF